ncbi:Imidazoleglycerol-phosphate dehydratase [hydrothermal vent metagenome]|uniref:Imidazoleglycerol-phosphate dehydratase n=1 Tax=hydrothermal vent metagenome TaxID=652676 RepID=A0A3B1CFA3_9ZZZZ
MSRTATISRTTKETDITIEVELDGSGENSVDTGIPFFDHMLDHLSKHSLIDITVSAKGDLEIDGHHTVEDIGLALGQAFGKAWGDKKGMTRYGFASIPMNESLVEVSLDISGRPYCVFEASIPKGKVGEFDVELAEEFVRAFINSAQITCHIAVRRGTNLHHIVEAMFKALARALGQAVKLDPRIEGVAPSTKGLL